MAGQPKTEEISAIGGFNNEEMEKLRSLLGSLDKPTGACSLTLLSIPSFSFCINALNKVYDDSWVIDSGATNHMTPKSQLFNTYSPSPSNKKISVANNSLATVAGFRDIYITPTLNIKNVLHVPKLSTILVSIQKLTHDLKYYAIFSLLFVFFRKSVRGGGLDLLRKGTVLTTLNYLRKLVIICLCLFSIPQIKIPFGCITYV